MQNNLQAQSSEDKLLCARIEDMVRQMDRDNMPCFTRFLDEREQTLALQTLRGIHFPPQQFCFWTGFSFDAQQEMPELTTGRKMLGLFPDYLAFTDGMERSVWEEQFPIQSVTLSYRERDGLTHRDILGSLMGLNLKRELIGEILTADDFAVIFCTETAAKVILSDLDRIGRVGIKKQMGFTELPPAYRLEYQTGTVSSMRLDCVVALSTNLSREKSAALIEGRLVNLNFFEETKISKEVAQGDILSIRGYGRFAVTQIGSRSKKGRLHLTVGKYV